MNSILDAILHMTASAPAVDDGERRFAYGELAERVEQERLWLHHMNVRRCGLLAENGAGWIVGDLALLGLEALNVPVPPSFTPAQIEHVVEDAALESVLTDDAPRWSRNHPTFTHVATSRQTGLALFQREVRPTSLASVASKVTYTSGSTGTAKGVCLNASMQQRVAESLAAATSSLGMSRHMCLLPLPTLLENIAGVYAPLLLGAEVRVRPAAAIGMSYGGLNVPLLLQAISNATPESLIVVPELLRVLVHASRCGWRAPASLKFIAVGGAVVATQLLEDAHAVGLPVYQGYGLSECASVVCLNTPGCDRIGSVGKPLPHARVRIDTNGEICVAGTVMSGYLGSVGPPSEEMRTGDLGHIDSDGFVHVHGRVKNLLITGMGKNIAPEWVEGELTAEAGILQALVTGEARPYLSALLVTAPGMSPRMIEAAVNRANSRLPDYARVRVWRSFPEPPSVANGLLTTNGRLRRDQIVARFAPLLESLYFRKEFGT